MMFLKKNFLFACFHSREAFTSTLASDNFDPLFFERYLYNNLVPFDLLACCLEKVSETRGKDSKAVQKNILCNFLFFRNAVAN